MSSGTFSSPLFVRRAAHIVQEIASPADAIDFLNEWPEHRRDRIYEAAPRACFDAYNGRIPASAARKTFPALGNRSLCWKMQPPRCNGSLPACRAVEKRKYRRRSRM
ncbi:DUF982 domain-containing protein [Mesorhizobium sp. M0923]|uniref:DUF982 domain-containing protein n=1 Tax=unclassified Mesorhizobium TaxID=325217 RepID=UPI00333BBD6C